MSTFNLQSQYRTGNLADGTVALGAQCSVGFRGLISIGGGTYDTWVDSFWKALMVGQSLVTAPDNVDRALEYARQKVNAIDPSSGYDNSDVAGNRYLQVVPIN